MTPIAYALLNPATGKIKVTKVYVREEAARAGAVRYSSRWRVLVVVGLFLHPSAYEPITEEQYAMARIDEEIKP